MHVQQTNAAGANGDRARKVVVMGLWKGFAQIHLGSLVKKVALVYLRKGKDAKYGMTIVKVLILLNDIYLCIRSDLT